MKNTENELIFNGDNAYAHLEKLCADIGPRHAGTDAERDAAHYIRDELKKNGASTSLFEYDIHTFTDATAELTVSGLGKVPCIALPFCASTPDEGISGDLVIKETIEEAVSDPSVKGKIIALLGSYMGNNYEKMMNARPAAVIQIGGGLFVKPGRGRVSPEAKQKYGAVPTVNITYEEGLRILAAKATSCTLAVKTDGEKTGTSHNVIGELTGNTYPEEIIVIGAHFDTVWKSPGSQDNGAGTAIMMELARVFSKRGSKRTLRFMAFGGEEMGLRGSIAYAQKLKSDDEKIKKDSTSESGVIKSVLDTIIFMINIDVMGTKLGSNSFFAFGHPDIAASVRLLCAETGPYHSVQDGTAYSSDNVPFGNLGIPSGTFGRSGGNSMFGHTTEDSIDHCSADALDKSGKFIETWMCRHITNPHAFPFERMIPPAAQQNLKEYLKQRGIQDLISENETK